MNIKCNIPAIKFNYLEELLKTRGVKNILDFIDPKKNFLLNPIELVNLCAAADCLMGHLEKNSKIGVVVDSDQDGYTSAAILWNYIKSISPLAHMEYFIHEGKKHGLESHIEIIEDSDLDLIILPDSSSNDYEFHERLFSVKKDIIVLDHHESEEYSKYALVVNNQMCDYENKGLSGAGVVYKFCQLLDTIYGCSRADYFLDLAAIGIIGDMMDVRPLENRYIIKYGLANINNLFIKEIIKKQSYSIGDISNLNSTHISFYVAPLINAMIRVGTQREKELMFEAFISGESIVDSTKRGAKGQKETLAEQMARNCVNARSKQKRLETALYDKIEAKIFNLELDTNKIIVVDIENCTEAKGLFGLAAMKICQKYGRPVLVGSINEDGELKGSARAPSNCIITDLKEYELGTGLFEFAEGHAGAHGFAIKQSNITKFLDRANEDFRNFDLSEGTYEVDFIRDSYDHDLKELIMDVGAKPEIWGNKNPEPLIFIDKIPVSPNNVQIMGANQNTIKIMYEGISYIMFNAKKLIEEIKTATMVKIVGRANINEWNGVYSPQIMIKDYEITEFIPAQETISYGGYEDIMSF